nr:transposase [Rubrivivax gelatinosus]
MAGSTAQRRVTTLPGEEFVERLLQHVLPSGFKRIRHYGLLAPAAKAQRLVCARALLAMPAAQPATREDVAEFMRRVAALDIVACPHCRGGRWAVLEQRGPQPCGPDGRAMDESCPRLPRAAGSDAGMSRPIAPDACGRRCGRPPVRPCRHRGTGPAREPRCRLHDAGTGARRGCDASICGNTASAAWRPPQRSGCRSRGATLHCPITPAARQV